MNCKVADCGKPAGKKAGGLCYMHKARIWRERHPLQAAWHSLLSSAKGRGIPVLLTFDDFAFWAVRTELLRGRGIYKTSWHIDRIESSGPYSLDNIQVLTNSANAEKENTRRKWVRAKDYLNEAGFILTAFYQPRTEDEPPEVWKRVIYDYELAQRRRVGYTYADAEEFEALDGGRNVFRAVDDTPEPEAPADDEEAPF